MACIWAYAHVGRYSGFFLCDDRGGTRWRGWRPVGFGLTERRTTRLMEHAKCGF
eukprot:SAG11_NODE_19163_length_472_cov_26.986595_1_plen_53_part_01